MQTENPNARNELVSRAKSAIRETSNKPIDVSELVGARLHPAENPKTVLNLSQEHQNQLEAYAGKYRGVPFNDDFSNMVGRLIPDL